MTARILPGLLALSFTAGAPAAPLSPELLPPTVGVLLKFDRKPTPGFVKQLQKEVAGIFQPTGLDLRWEILDGKHGSKTYNRVVMIEMRGRCTPFRAVEATPQGGTPEGGLSLGWTLIGNGEVLPFAVVSCDQIAVAMANMRAQMPNRQVFPSMYTRLAGRVVAHELMHTLLRTPEHHASDATRSPLHPADLDVQAQLRPEEVTALRGIARSQAPTLAQGEKKAGSSTATP